MSTVAGLTVNEPVRLKLAVVRWVRSTHMATLSSPMIPPQAAFMALGVPSSLYVPMMYTTCGYSRVLAPWLFLMKRGWRNVPITMTRRSRSEAADGDDIHPIGASVTVFGSGDDHLERRETYAVAGILLIGPPDLLLEFIQAPPALFD